MTQLWYQMGNNIFLFWGVVYSALIHILIDILKKYLLSAWYIGDIFLSTLEISINLTLLTDEGIEIILILKMKKQGSRRLHNLPTIT